jgi:hypothetical protein
MSEARFAILKCAGGGSGVKPGVAYRGTQRASPVIEESMPSDHAVNVAIMQYIQGTDEGTTRDPALVERTLATLGRYLPGHGYEAVQITRASGPVTVGGALYGYDVSYEFYGSMVKSLIVEAAKDSAGRRSHEVEYLLPLIEVFTAFFLERVNDNMLFSDVATADWFRRCVVSFDTIHRSIFEDEAAMRSYEVVAVHAR